MAGKELVDPELEAREGSEIEAVVDVTAVGIDGVCRPVFINQAGEDFIQITMEDAIRLRKFLNDAIPFLEEWRDRTTQ